MSKSIVLVVTTHFADSDPDCLSDYCEVTIELDGQEVARYGDAYHDRGREKADGWVDAVRHLIPTVVVERKNVADHDL